MWLCWVGCIAQDGFKYLPVYVWYRMMVMMMVVVIVVEEEEAVCERPSSSSSSILPLLTIISGVAGGAGRSSTVSPLLYWQCTWSTGILSS